MGEQVGGEFPLLSGSQVMAMAAHQAEQTAVAPAHWLYANNGGKPQSQDFLRT